MNRFSSSIFVCGLFVFLAQFALLSEGGNICLGSQASEPRARGEGTSSSSRDRPDIPADLEHLLELQNHLVAINSKLYSTINFISPRRMSDCAGRYIRGKVGTGMPKESFEAQVRERVIEPCQRLNNLLEDWFKVAKYDREPDPWYFTARICNGIVVQTYQNFVDHAYNYYLTADTTEADSALQQINQ